MSNNTKEQFSIKEEQPVEWFEPLYAESNKSGEGVPWANMQTHPSFTRWLINNQVEGHGKKALVVGCGMGDDAIELEALGFQVTAFDVSETAIKFCKERFQQSKVNFLQANLLENQRHWLHKFDFVLEIFTVQALPPKYEKTLIQNISNFVASDGQLLVVAEVGKEERLFENGPPWVLTTQHINSFVSCGLEVVGQSIDKDPSSFGELGTYITVFERSAL